LQLQIWDESSSTLYGYGPAQSAGDTNWYYTALDFGEIITDVRGQTINVQFVIDQDDF
jgi:hypothetical protein